MKQTDNNIMNNSNYKKLKTVSILSRSTAINTNYNNEMPTAFDRGNESLITREILEKVLEDCRNNTCFS